MPSRSGVIAGGHWIVDYVKVIDAWPSEDSLVTIRGESRGNGGCAYNILKDLARLGADFPLEAIGLIGDDANADFIIEDCRRHGIDTRQMRRTREASTSYTDVMSVRTSGRRTFFHQPGANAHLAPGHFDFSRTRARFFHFGYLLLLDEMDRLDDGIPRALDVLRRASQAGLQTSLDCVSVDSDQFQSVVWPVLPEVDLLFANDYEAEKLTGIPLRRHGAIVRESVERAAAELVSRGVRRCVVLHFPEATFALEAGRLREGLWQPSLKVPADANKGMAGAGDALAAGVLYSLHEGRPIESALRLGVCAAASCLSEPTCSDGILPAADCERLPERWGFAPL